MVEAEAADVHAEEIEIIDDEEEGADSAASQVYLYTQSTMPPAYNRMYVTRVFF